MSVTITRDEWLGEFERVMRGTGRGDPGLTTWELGDRLGITHAKADMLLQTAAREGRLLIGKKPGTARDGRRCMVPCYQLKVEPRRAAKKR